MAYQGQFTGDVQLPITSAILKTNSVGKILAAVAGVDYLTSGDLSGYLPLTGGTLTGPLGGTSASFSNSVYVGSSGSLEVGYGSVQGLYKLDVNGTGRFSETLRVQSSTTWANINVVGASSTQGGQVDFYGSTIRYGTIVGEYESAGNGKITLRTWTSSGTTPVSALTLASTGAATFSNNILINDSYGLVNVASISTGFFATSSLTLLLKSNGSTALTIASSLAATFSSNVTSLNSGGTYFSAENSAGGYAKLEISSNATSLATLSFTNSLDLIGGNVNIGSIYNYSTLNILASSSPALTITDGYNGKFTLIPYENTTNGHLIKSTNYANNTYYPLTLAASRVQTPNGSLVVGGTNDNGYAFYTNGAGKFTGDLTSNSLKTSAPTGGTSQNWKLGTVVSGTCVPANFGGFTSWFTGNVIEIEVNGTTYYVPAVVPNYC